MGERKLRYGLPVEILYKETCFIPRMGDFILVELLYAYQTFKKI